MFRIPYIFSSHERFLERCGLKKNTPGAITRDNFFDLYFSLKRPFVVQIGANDGKTHDPLHTYILKYQLSGLLVEPQPDIFKVLQENYTENKNLRFANVAVGEKEGKIPFYRIRPDLVMEGREYKASSGSSFYKNDVIENVKNRLPPKRNDILKPIAGTPEEYVQEIYVQTRHPNILFSEYEIKKIDFLLLDCQGADYTILKLFDFKTFSPDIINYEHSLLTPTDILASRALLMSHGYRYFIHEGDTCAYKIA